ncbi:TIGR00730 family Rossman fold protein [Lysobacteraceae bacterium NML95-0200]|nr:TIGR00730 family Rossman fold protein [Xanthomonadaceae bacterium NML95-0200]
MQSICLYCGSKPGNRPEYAQLAAALGEHIARSGLRLVYGGGRVGLMGIAADAALATGGEVIGIIPQQLVDWEAAHPGLTRLEVVATMHQRKMRMFELGDAFVALPGGFGTLDEMFEMLTWQQLGINSKPCAFLGTPGFWQPLMQMMERMVAEGFLPARQHENVWQGEDIGALWAWMHRFDTQLPSRLVAERRQELAL